MGTDLVLLLDDVRIDDAEHAGRKAAVLGELRSAGFPVPDGVVLSVAARPDRAGAAVPAQVAEALAAAAARLGSGLLAVRSSGVAEDEAGASYAGQYETVLGVRPAEVPAAVRRCWDSALATHVTAYRRARGAEPGPPLAVLVQPLVPAEVAGVAFTADPVTGDRDTVLVSAVRGLGDRLVEGAASPDEWVVRGDVATARSAPEGVLDSALARAVADLARRVAARLGGPQDVEWAYAAGELVLLQARPITALPDPPTAPRPEPVPVPVEVPAGFWEREASHAPVPWTPLALSTFLPTRNDAVRQAFDDSGLLAETLEWRQIGGWEYTRIVPLGGKDRPALPRWLMALLMRTLPSLRRRLRDSATAMREDRAGTLLRRWYEQWRPELTARIEALRAVDPAALDDASLDEHTARALALTRDGTMVHFRIHGALTILMAELAFSCRDLLGWSDEQTMDLLAGLSATSTEPAHRLAELARIPAGDPRFAPALAEYERTYGRRALRYEIAEPTMVETPGLIRRLIADQAARGYDPDAEQAELTARRATATAAARAALAGRPAADVDRFERALVRAQRGYPVREDNAFYTTSAPLAELRYAVLEIGRRLAARGLLDDRDDVFWLTLDEARDSLRTGADRHPLVRRRRGERAWIEQHPGPASYGRDPGPPPALDVLPAASRFPMEALLWNMDRIFAADMSGRTQPADSAELTGLAAAPGSYTGPVRVIRNESEFDRIHPGDVLVCPVTSPVWSVLFASIGALVTDTGGLLSHPAIIAREYRVPAVVATGNATALLADGEVVTVDGSTGRVLR